MADAGCVVLQQHVLEPPNQVGHVCAVPLHVAPLQVVQGGSVGGQRRHALGRFAPRLNKHHGRVEVLGRQVLLRVAPGQLDDGNGPRLKSLVQPERIQPPALFFL